MITQKEIDVEVWELVDTTKNLYISNKEDIEMKEYEIKIRLTETEAEQLIKAAGLKTDDRLMNLTLLSKQEAGSMFASRSRRRGIYKVDPENRNILAFYKSSREAAAKEYCSYQTILDSCNGKTRRNATGYSFVWSEVVDDSSGWI